MDISFRNWNLKKIEFWLATAVFTVNILALLMGGNYRGALNWPGETITPMAYYFRELAEYLTLYFSFLLLNFYVVPNLVRKHAVAMNLIVTVAVFVVIGVVLGNMEYAVFPMFGFAIYTMVKYTLLYISSISSAVHTRYRFIAPGVLLACALWAISMLLFLIGAADRVAITIWVTLIPFGIVLYSYSFYSLIPQSLGKKYPFRAYLWKVFVLLLIAGIPLAIIAMFLTQGGDAPLVIAFANMLFQFLLTAPFSWIFFKRYKKGTEELVSLQKELGQSTANIDFLRSQINPHFLFNALNTLYGTAIQENADRTGEGIQKLGDMMRFMLQENMQPKISLTREIEYLNNYISLQKLRTDPVPGIKIETQIDDPLTYVQIAPMLLIPFVENAFKHGISLREPSYIKISLEVNNNRLNFDVSNSSHPRQQNDPEKNMNGIGLNNVRQRLQLLYPARHELIIRETGKEFFIHLSIQLS